MKFRSLLQLIVVVLVGQFLFACSSAEYYRFSSAKPESYNKSVAKTEPADAVKENKVTVAETMVSTPVAPSEIEKAEPVLEANAKAKSPVLLETKKTAVSKFPVSEAMPVVQPEASVALESAKARLSSMTKAEKKEFRKEVRSALRETNDAGTVVKIILAILIPPLAVFLHEGLGSRFWISLLLTLLFIIPGIVYALLVVTDTI
ncbi:YqaE/Pmp3 family membrane protein [Rufibacter tibetensis]|uniref:YqaE/Pmp3 family membrane protein n=1 Tax=Rufibacter tibetensis TaxID=512763 RepID=UPI000A6B90FA|nr:YqaE/Pmp3 family membrane protein [Rufibacter tibetensis]